MNIPMKSVERGLFTSLASLFVSAGCDVWAQVPEGGWVSQETHSWVNYHSQNLMPVTSAAISRNAVWDGLAVDHRGIIYSIDSYALWRVWYDAQQPYYQLIVEFPGIPYTNEPTPFHPLGAHMVATREELWMLEAVGVLKHIPLAYSGHSVATVANILPASRQGSRCTTTCTNGRELFVGILTPSFVSEVWALDLRAPLQPMRHVATIPSLQSYQISLVLRRDGNLLAMALDGLYAVDVGSGQVSFVCSRPQSYYFSILQGQTPQYLSDANIRLAYDPWTDVVAMSPPWLVDTTIIYQRNMQSSGGFTFAFGNGFFGGLRKIVSASEQPFESFGQGCSNSQALEPRMAWQGLPSRGQSFGLSVRDAEPAGVAVFWIGASDRLWPGLGPLPFDVSAHGAPGCRIHASGDMSYLAAVDGAGRSGISVPIPVTPALNGMEVFAQSASTSGVNALGFVASDAVAIRIR
jgi:hypothetical protein